MEYVPNDMRVGGFVGKVIVLLLKIEVEMRNLWIAVLLALGNTSQRVKFSTLTNLILPLRHHEFVVTTFNAHILQANFKLSISVCFK